MSIREPGRDYATSLFAIGCGILILAACNSSRYGMVYDRRLPQLKRIAVVPVGVEVYSLHSGGIAEPRPDEVGPASARLASAVAAMVRDRGAEPLTTSQPALPAASGEAHSARLALLTAVRDSILTHHYQHGKERTLSYTTAGAVGAVATDDVDAVLCIYATGVVPTSGRQALQTTAAVIGLVTGVHIHVSTYQLSLILMLLDRANGDVLWFNQYYAESSIRSADDVRRACRNACAYLLKPRD